MPVFEPKIETIGQMDEYGVEDLKKEPMFFRASLGYVYKHGGIITREFISLLPEEFIEHCYIDSRTHMLMKGWYPAIPGWHHDDVPRTGPKGQPNYTNPEYHAEQVMTVIDLGTGAMTEFLDQRISLEVPEQGIVYEKWNEQINDIILGSEVICQTIGTRRIKSGEILAFDAHTFHRAMPATGKGFRMFIRATHNSTVPIRNEIRSQSNVYMSALEAGW